MCKLNGYIGSIYFTKDPNNENTVYRNAEVLSEVQGGVEIDGINTKLMIEKTVFDKRYQDKPAFTSAVQRFLSNNNIKVTLNKYEGDEKPNSEPEGDSVLISFCEGENRKLFKYTGKYPEKTQEEDSYKENKIYIDNRFKAYDGIKILKLEKIECLSTVSEIKNTEKCRYYVKDINKFVEYNDKKFFIMTVQEDNLIRNINNEPVYALANSIQEKGLSKYTQDDIHQIFNIQKQFSPNLIDVGDYVTAINNFKKLYEFSDDSVIRLAERIILEKAYDVLCQNGANDDKDNIDNNNIYEDSSSSGGGFTFATTDNYNGDSNKNNAYNNDDAYTDDEGDTNNIQDRLSKILEKYNAVFSQEAQSGSDAESPQNATEQQGDITSKITGIGEIKPYQQNEIINLLICLTQGMITVITGESGNGKSAVCNALGEMLGLVNIPGDVPDRYKFIGTSGHWDSRDKFLNEITAQDSSYTYPEPTEPGMFDILTYEAEKEENPDGSKSEMPPCIIALLDADKSPVDKYLEDFITIHNNWYWSGSGTNRGEFKFRLPDGKEQCIPETMRFLLTMDDNSDGILSDSMTGAFHTIEYKNGVEISKLLEQLTEAGTCVSLQALEGEFGCFGIKDAKDLLKTKKDYYEIYKHITEFIDSNVRCDGVKTFSGSGKTERAVSRYWSVARAKLTPEPIPEELYKYSDGDTEQKEKQAAINSLKKKYVPENIIIDDTKWELKLYDTYPDENYETGVITEIRDGETIIDPLYCFIGKNRTKNIIALDYALSQRVLTYMTRRRGKITVTRLEELVEYLIENRLFRCLESLKAAVDSERVKIADELSDESNDKFIITKSRQIHKKLLDNTWGQDESKEEELREKDSDRYNRLIRHICELVNLERDKDTYTRNVIVNMLICLTQGFITVFSGKPGCGKTSICEILGKMLGLTNSSSQDKRKFSEYEEFKDRRGNTIDTSRYLVVSTERGWTSKRDFIGYYNPLTEQFDKVNALLYNTFLVLDAEAKEIEEKKAEKKLDGNNGSNKTLPCFILLDEANLSPMEYYWADFMNVCEKWEPSNSIDLGGGRTFKLPESLHFIATINNDHTTEILSPRLIDRANVIDLPVPTVDQKMSDTDEEISPVSWDVLKEVFSVSEEDAKLFKKNKNNKFIHNKEVELYNEIVEDIENDFNISISPRTQIAVSRYWTVASELFKETNYSVSNELTGINFDDYIEHYNPDNSDKSHDDDKVSIREFTSVIDNKASGNKSDKDDNPGKNYKPNASTQAFDYAVAQRLLPKITDVSGSDAFENLKKLFITLRDNELYKSAGIVLDIIRRGDKTGFYNYFR